MGIDAFDLEVTPERGTPCALVTPCIAKEETNSFDRHPSVFRVIY